MYLAFIKKCTLLIQKANRGIKETWSGTHTLVAILGIHYIRTTANPKSVITIQRRLLICLFKKLLSISKQTVLKFNRHLKLEPSCSREKKNTKHKRKIRDIHNLGQNS